MILNLVTLNLNNYGIKIFKAPFQKDIFDSCRDRYEDYCFLRVKDETYAWSKRQTTVKLDSNFSETYIYSDKNSRIFARIIEESLKEFYLNDGRGVEFFYQKYIGCCALLFKKSEKVWGKLRVCPKLEYKILDIYSEIDKKVTYNLIVNWGLDISLDITKEESESSAFNQFKWILNKSNQRVSNHSKNIEKYLQIINKARDYNTFINQFSPENQYSLLGRFVDHLNGKLKFSIFLPDNLKILSAEINIVNNGRFGQSDLGKPKRYFYNEAVIEGCTYDSALKQKKTYSYDVLKMDRVKIFSVVPKTSEGAFSRFEDSLRTNLMSVFHLTDISLEKELVEQTDLESISAYLDDVNLDGYDLVIIVLRENDKNEQVNNSKYFNLKSKLLNRKIPTQFVTAEKIQTANSYYLNNISLNIYAKLGGTAWTIEKTDDTVKEFVIGIGSTVDELKHQVIGFANVFEHNGSYIVGNCNNATGVEDYTYELYKQIKGTIESHLSKYINDSNLRLIFHLFKPASKKYEIKAIEMALAEYPSTNVTYAIVHISREHPYRIYKQNEVEKMNRGLYIQIDKYSSLLYLNRKGYQPLQIKLDTRSTYKDLFALTQQIYFFSDLSYRAFMPANIPVTIQYPNLMARIMSNLNLIGKWDTGIVKQLENKLWFL